MKSILSSVIILISLSGALSAQNISAEYFDDLEIKSYEFQDNQSTFTEINSLDSDDFEIEVPLSKYVKTFVVMGAKISDLLSSFDLDSLGLGFGANVQVNESLSCYAKYSTSKIENESLISIDSSVVYVGLAYSF